MDLNFSYVLEKVPILVEGCKLTIIYSVFSLIFGLALGIVVALMRDSVIKLVKAIAWFYTWIIRGTPLMIQLFIIYYGLPQFKITLSAATAGMIGMTLNNAAFMSEIVRSGIQGVDPGEREAARALGMGKGMEMIRIVAPQAAKLCLLPMVNQFIMTIKNSSLLSTITIAELTRNATVIANSSFLYFEFYITIALVYLLLTSLCMIFASWVERKLTK